MEPYPYLPTQPGKTTWKQTSEQKYSTTDTSLIPSESIQNLTTNDAIKSIASDIDLLLLTLISDSSTREERIMLCEYILDNLNLLIAKLGLDKQ